MNNRTHIYLDKSLRKEANWLIPTLSTVGTVAAHGAVGHLVQNQISKKMMGHEAQLAHYRDSFLAGTMGHSDLPAKHQAAVGVKRVISPEIGIIHDEVNQLGRHIKEHLDQKGLHYGTLPAHHYEYAQALVSGKPEHIQALESKHKDIAYMKNAITSKFPHVGEVAGGVSEKFQQSTIGKVLNKLVEKPKGPLPMQSSPTRAAARKFVGRASEAVGTAGMAYADTGTALLNVTKRVANAPVDAVKHPLINKAKTYLMDKMVNNPIKSSFQAGAAGKTSKIKTWAQTNIVNPLVGETSSIANDLGRIQGEGRAKFDMGVGRVKNTIEKAKNKG